MAHIEQYLKSYSSELISNFQRTRQLVQDCDVKGGQNEQIVAKFIDQHWQARSVRTNVQIVDSSGNQSGEVDICATNQYQPFSDGVTPQIVIAEGVDFVVQVKAVLTDSELDRIVVNCSSIKKLRRDQRDNLTKQSAAEGPYVRERIPYVVWAFDTQLSLGSIVDRLSTKLKGVPFEEQFDALLLLNRFVILNLKDGQSRFKPFEGSDGPILGICGVDSKEGSLGFLMVYLQIQIPTVIRTRHPLVYYLPHLPPGVTEIYTPSPSQT